MAELTTNVQYIKGIGQQRAAALHKLGIDTLYDLVSYFPRAYEDRREMRPISQLVLEESACVQAMVKATPKLSHIRKGLDLVKLQVVDDSGQMDITFFNQAYVKNQLVAGQTYVFYGKVGGNLLRPAMTNPSFEPVGRQELTGRILPIYPLTAGVSQTILMRSVRQGLDACGDILPDPLPGAVREAFSLAHANFAYENIHFPTDWEALAIAKRRLVFEEWFVLSCALRLFRGRRETTGGLAMPRQDPAAFYAALPFSLTGAQRRALEACFADLSSGRPMNRLIQGDVGSGKTAVAAGAAWYAISAGYQAAFMAPTEILARQHLETLSGFLQPLGLRVGLLLGSMSAKEKRTQRELIAQGYYHLVVGTHALLTGDVEFQNLGLAITDEQHRFGVEQRAALAGKGQSPHILVMSATPIPRTLALMIYGDLDVSVIDELPPGRQPVETYAVREKMRQRIYRFMRKLVGEGRQVFVVCPMIEESEEGTNGWKAAETYWKELSQKVFPDLRVSLVHGRMKAQEKNQVMEAFAAGEADILVSTTVIEVGVDVPNAALMVVENADRFGLSQLHQLRGRVGRGKHKSYCVLFNASGSPEATQRLQVLCKTNNGFQIAEADLKLRGPGDFFGSRQHGLPELKIAKFSEDLEVLHTAQAAAGDLMAADPGLDLPEHQRLKQRITDLFAQKAEALN